MTTASLSCILLTSDNEHLASSAETFARTLFDVRHVSRHSRSQKSLPSELVSLTQESEIDFLFNFLSPMIIPGSVLGAVKRASINFHPAPPEWPGVGSASYAIYENDRTFGVTAHVMTEKIDAGPIVRVIRFPIFPADTCDRLFGRALNYSLILFYEVLSEIGQSGAVPSTGETWKRRTLTRAQFEKWITVSPQDPSDEIQRKVRAVRHSRFPGPFIEVAGLRFELPPRKGP